MKEFTFADVVNHDSAYARIYASRADLMEAMPAWMAQGLQQTASGYGRKLNTGLKIRFNGRDYRVYCTIFSNIGTVWFKSRGRRIVVS